MRVRRLVALSVLASCAFGARAEDVAAGSVPEPERLHSIDMLEATCDGGVLTVTATATASSLGWKMTRLQQTEVTKDTISFEAVGVRPEMSGQALEEVRLASQQNIEKGVTQVHVDAQTNSLDAEIMPAC